MTELPSKTGAEMSEEAKRSLLESERHGVLSMGAGNRGYGLPVAYRYVEENDHIVLGFVDALGSKKQQFADQSEEVTLTVYNFEDVDSWESVIVTGTIQQVSEEDVPDQLSTLFFFEEDGAASDRRAYDFDEYERTRYELRIEDITGRHTGTESAG